MTLSALQQHPPEWWGTQEYYNETTLHPFGLAMVVVLGLSMLLASRSRALLPFLLMACFIAPAQRLVILTLDFNLMRLMVMFALVRILMRGEYKGLRANALDLCILLWICATSMIYVLRVGTAGSMVNRAGATYDALGMYSVCRILIRDRADIQRLCGQIAWTSVVVFTLFLVERATERNPFAFLGGVPELTKIRDGRFRCQGPFKHAILAGVFWAALIPLVAGSWFGRFNRWRDGVALCCMLGIVGLTASSTPVMAVFMGALGWAAWSARNSMRAVRWAALASVVALHLTMNRPVWHLIGRLNIVGGSTGYHRYRLIQSAIDNFDEWWLMGVTSTAHWGRMMHDITNHYLRIATDGGLLALVLFLATLSLAFRGAGIARKRFLADIPLAKLCWGVGVAIFVQSVLFFAISVSHSPQNEFVFFLVMAASGTLRSYRQSWRSSKRLIASAGPVVVWSTSNRKRNSITSEPAQICEKSLVLSKEGSALFRP